MNGVDIGNVHRIVIAGDSPRVEITFTVKMNVAPHIREDASVVIRPMGLLGDKFVEILPGTPSKPPLAPGGVLVGQAEADIGGIASGATTTIENVNAAIRDIQRLLLAISQGEGTASKLLTDPSLYDRSTKVLEKLEVASDKSIVILDKVNRGEGTIGQLVSDKDLYNRASQILQVLSLLTLSTPLPYFGHRAKPCRSGEVRSGQHTPTKMCWSSYRGPCQTRVAMIPLPVMNNVVKVLAGNGGLK